MIRRVLLLVGAALAAFHVWLFAGQVWSGALADPGLIFRWLVAAELVGGLVVLKRQGESLVWGRKAVALWVLTALLHSPALATRIESTGAVPIPEIVVTLTQTAAGLVGLVGLTLFLAGLATHRRPAFVAPGRPAVCVSLPAWHLSAGCRFAPRPPPFTN